MIRILLILLLNVAAFAQTSASSEWKPVESALGRSGSAQPGGIYKFSLPRTDMHVRLGDVDIAAPLALGSWLAFKKASAGGEAMVMGDLVLSESELTPVLTSLQQQGIDQTAVHNHLIGEAPRVIYMHISGHGDAVKLAESLKTALALTKTPAQSTAPAAPPKLEFDTAAITQILGPRR
jgi:hypothetical protein